MFIKITPSLLLYCPTQAYLQDLTDIHKVNTATLNSNDAHRFNELISSAHIFDLPQHMRLHSPKPWDFTYTMVVKEGNNLRALEFHKSAAPDGLQKLVEAIEELE